MDFALNEDHTMETLDGPSSSGFEEGCVQQRRVDGGAGFEMAAETGCIASSSASVTIC